MKKENKLKIKAKFTYWFLAKLMFLAFLLALFKELPRWYDMIPLLFITYIFAKGLIFESMGRIEEFV